MASKLNLPSNIDKDKLLEKLQHEKKTALKYQKRRHQPWLEIYELYRNIIRTNRLTQRQAINIPLMKETIKTIGSKINTGSDIHLADRGGEVDKEIIVNALWQNAAEAYSWDLLDRVDKKQEQLYGRSHFVLNVDPSKDIPVTIDVKDVFELLVDPKTKPYDIDTARYTVETNIYKPLDEILTSDRYDSEAKGKLKTEYSKTGGRTGRSESYKRQLMEKNQRLQSLGVTDVADLEGYDKIVALDGHITHLWDKALKQYVKYYVLVANEAIILSADTLANTIGVDFYPYEGWADDLEITDYWSDGTGDLILVPNKTINSWISQYMENRTLRSFGMNFYDATIEGFTPATFQPRPWGWYPLAGKPNEVYQNVEVPSLEGTIEDIQFIVSLAEKASATGAVEKGAVEDVKRTLGEIELAVGSAMRRTNDMAVFYEHARKRLVSKWYKMLEANVPESKKLKLYKKTQDGRISENEVSRDQWVSEKGYTVEVTSKQQRLADTVDEIQRLKVVQQEFPNNKALRKAVQKRMISMVDLTPTEVAEIQDEETRNLEAMVSGFAQGGMPAGAGTVPAQGAAGATPQNMARQFAEIQQGMGA